MKIRQLLVVLFIVIFTNVVTGTTVYLLPAYQQSKNLSQLTKSGPVYIGVALPKECVLQDDEQNWDLAKSFCQPLSWDRYMLDRTLIKYVFPNHIGFVFKLSQENPKK